MSVTVNLTGVRPDYVRESMANANKTPATGTTELFTTATLTTPRIVTMQLASNFPAGREFVFVDEFLGISPVNTVTFNISGSDTINGSASLIFGATGGILRFISDGVSKFTVNSGSIITSSYFILKDAVTNHKWKFTVDSTGMLSQPGEDLGI